jgi:hypothetical protein
MRARVPCPQSVASPWLPPRVVPNQIISYTLRTAKDPLQAARRLAAKAFSAGAKDNVSLRRSPFGRPTPRKGRSQELTHSKMRAQASFPSAQKYGSGYGPSNSQLQEALKNKHFSANMAEREGFEPPIRFRPSGASNYKTPALVATRIAVMKSN